MSAEIKELYVKLVDRLLPEEEPDEEDVKAIREEDEIVGEEEFFKVLRK